MAWSLGLFSDARRLRVWLVVETALFFERDRMRKVTLGVIAVLGLLAVSDSASAKDRSSRKMRYSQPQQQYYYQEQRPNLFQQMWDMEQRKNAWLRQTFFGR
jgi:hypothetical protein